MYYKVPFSSHNIVMIIKIINGQRQYCICPEDLKNMSVNCWQFQQHHQIAASDEEFQEWLRVYLLETI